MSLDVRWPIGLLFLLLGALLVIWGLAGPAPPTGGPVSLNVNAWWGGVMLAFGGVMALLAWSGRP